MHAFVRAALFLGLITVGPSSLLADDPYAVHTSDAGFEEVMDNLKLAIQERGMYINNVMHMGEMLERTGGDLGFDRQIYLKAKSVEFCSAVLSRKMTAEKPSRIVNCPFIVSVYVLPDRPDATYVAYRKVPGSEAEQSAVMAEIAAMLEGVAEAAVAW